MGIIELTDNIQTKRYRIVDIHCSFYALNLVLVYGV